MNLPVNASRAARLNRVQLLEAVQRAGTISRSELVRVTGLTPATITNAVRELVDRRLLEETGRPAPRLAARAGAPSYLLALNHDHHRVLAVHQGVTATRLGILDLAGTLLAEGSLTNLPDESPRASVRRIAGGLRKLMAHENLGHERVAGLGVGAVGLVDPGRDTVRTAPNLGWSEVPLGPWLAEELELPVVVRNNVHGMAAGELRVRGIPEPCALYVYVGFGIGGAVVAGGRVLEGAHGAAGEVGHLAVRGGGPCTCGKAGCLETVASERVLAERARSLVGGEPGVTKPSVRRLVDMAEAGDVDARGVVDQAARALGEALAQAVEVLDVAAIIVSGELARARATVLEPLAATLRESVFAVRGRRVEVRATEIANPGLVGAATLALDAFVFHPEAEILAERVSAPMLRGAVS